MRPQVPISEWTRLRPFRAPARFGAAHAAQPGSPQNRSAARHGPGHEYHHSVSSCRATVTDAAVAATARPCAAGTRSRASRRSSLTATHARLAAAAPWITGSAPATERRKARARTAPTGWGMDVDIVSTATRSTPRRSVDCEPKKTAAAAMPSGKLCTTSTAVISTRDWLFAPRSSSRWAARPMATPSAIASVQKATRIMAPRPRELLLPATYGSPSCEHHADRARTPATLARAPMKKSDTTAEPGRSSATSWTMRPAAPTIIPAAIVFPYAITTADRSDEADEMSQWTGKAPAPVAKHANQPS
mmetsp:Transcript_26902/g.79296  ORF Transcript_26902/g.79296 Transcript_26902/m.79296 type:complete len:304 (-) Transcript_26902:296-1207(-)